VSASAALLALCLPLTLDTFVASCALAAAGHAGRRTSLVLAAFEGGMPLAGAALGTAAASLLGRVASGLAIALLAGSGAALLLRGDEAEERRLHHLAGASGPALVAVGVAVSADELAVGAGLGLLGALTALASLRILPLPGRRAQHREAAIEAA
jgi:putative Mn2+ efflux pump MntP